MDYQAGHIKHDAANNSVAIRTIFPEEQPIMNMAWVVSTPHSGARNVATSEVEAWPDLYVPSAP